MREDLAKLEGSTRGFSIGQNIEVTRGPLAGLTGVLIGFSEMQKCQIELDVVQRGVFLVIDPAAVKQCLLAAGNRRRAGVDASERCNKTFLGRS